MRRCAVIVVALDAEYKAVRSHLKDLIEEHHPKGNVYGRGVFASDTGNWVIRIVQTRKGDVKAAVQTERAISFLNLRPNVVIFLGVAGGIKDVRLGDVVVAEKVYAYEAGKDGSSFQPRPEIGVPAFRLIEQAQAEAKKDDWVRRIKSTAGSAPHVFIGPIAAGEKVIGSKLSTTYKFVRKNYGDSLAVDTEDYGFLQAAHANPDVDALVIRGISDLISKKRLTDELGWQEKAARNASAFAFEVLAKLRSGGIILSETDLHHTRKEVPNKRMQKDYGDRFLRNILPSIATTIRHKEALSIVLLDIDELTIINKRYGRHVGNNVIAAIARVLFLETGTEYSGRCGDDTYYVMLSGFDIDKAERMAERLSESVARQPWESLASGLRVTCTFGVSQIQMRESIRDWVIRAAVALNNAKKDDTSGYIGKVEEIQRREKKAAEQAIQWAKGAAKRRKVALAPLYLSKSQSRELRDYYS